MPLTNIESYSRPTDVDGAWRLLVDGDGTARLLGGGTDLVVGCPPEVTTVIDLVDAGLRYVEEADDGGLRIGAMTTFTDLLEHPATARVATGVLAETLGQVGSLLHRNTATIGGHLARARMSDVIPVLVALDAGVTVFDGDRRELPVATYLDRGSAPHIVVEVTLPAPPAGSAAAFVRFSRVAYDHALLNAACRIDVDGPSGAVAAARVVVGETAAVGRRLAPAEEVLLGAPLTTEAIAGAAAVAREAHEARGDWVASSEYRRHLAGVAVERCLTTVSERLPGGRP